MKATNMKQDINLSGKIALVTGASRGIGAAVAKAYARAGAHVILLARTQGALEEVDDAIRAEGGSATIFPFDLSKLRDINKIGITIAERFGALDILVCNAGMLGTLGPLAHANPKEWDQVFEINVHANMRLLQSVDALLQRSPAGRVIFTGSMTYNRPKAYWGAYRVSKAAVNMLALTYAAETEQTNIRVNIVHPGAVETCMLEKAFPGGYPGNNVITLDDLARIYLELASEECARHAEILKV